MSHHTNIRNFNVRRRAAWAEYLRTHNVTMCMVCRRVIVSSTGNGIVEHGICAGCWEASEGYTHVIPVSIDANGKQKHRGMPLTVSQRVLPTLFASPVVGARFLGQRIVYMRRRTVRALAKKLHKMGYL